MRATVRRVVVDDRAYLLRIGASTLVDPAFEIEATRIAADAGLAPRVHFADPVDRVLVTDFVDGAPFPPDFALRLAPMIARIHALPAWPKTIHHLDMIERFLAPLRIAGKLAGLDDVLAGLGKLADYPRDVVACHNDLKAPNILYDGTRAWVIDWEASFNNDRYADLANAATFFVDEDDAAEAAFLAAYFDAPATAAQRARFVAARFANHVAYVALLAQINGEVVTDSSIDYRAFHAGVIAGTIDIATAKRDYAAVHLAAARRALTRLA